MDDDVRSRARARQREHPPETASRASDEDRFIFEGLIGHGGDCNPNWKLALRRLRNLRKALVTNRNLTLKFRGDIFSP